MSPPVLLDAGGLSGFPRVSGDEPTTTKYTLAGLGFSPRERG